MSVSTPASKVIFLLLFLCLLMTPLQIGGKVDNGLVSGSLSEETVEMRLNGRPHDARALRMHRPPFVPVYRIPLRVHLGRSGRNHEQFKEILEEINRIWWSQAGICFEMRAVIHDRVLGEGMDVWFLPQIDGGDLWNGYYRGDHEIRVRDTPFLGPARNPARHPAARTAAHEFGHGLELKHRQESDDNLMRSKTFGWQLSGEEIVLARKTASQKALSDVTPLRCGPPMFPQ